MLSLKAGVKLSGLRPEMVVALMVAKDVLNSSGYPCVVTSALDGKHGRGSLHYVGLAIDIRTRHIESDKTKALIKEKIAAQLGAEFDVVLEKTHMHIEHQPK